MTKSFNGIHPQIDDSAYLADTAVVIGDVHIGNSSSIWFNVVIRGDVNSIRIGKNTNIQDQTLLHVSGYSDADHPGASLVIGNDVTIGHSSIIHGCTIEDGAFIGMKSLLMDGVIVGKRSMVAAGSLVTSGTVIPAETLWLGSPAKFKRMLTEEELARAAARVESYVTLARKYKDEAAIAYPVDLP